MKRRFTLLAALSVLQLTSVPAAWALPDQTLADYSLGRTLEGVEIKKGIMRGRVVVIEYWGTR